MQPAVEERGIGQPLWLLHGLGASRDHQYATADALSGHFRCYLPDFRGHGDSPGGEIVSLRTFAEDLLPGVAANPGPVVGLSLGALVAMELWHLLPDLPAIVLVDPMLDVAPLWEWASRGAATDREAYRNLISPYLEPDVDRLVELMAGHPLTADLAEPLRRQNAVSHLRADHKTIQDALKVMRREPAPTAWTRPAGATGSALILRALRSPACPEAAAAAVAEAIGAEVAGIDSGHCVSLQAPELLAEMLVRRFGGACPPGLGE